MGKIILIVTFLILLLMQNTLGCSCYAPSSIGYDLQYADFVFTGKAISSKEITVWNDYQTLEGKPIKEKERATVYIFQIFEILKGKTIKKFVEINAGNIYSSCRGGFEIGESYLVYSWGKNEKKLKGSTSCGSSKDISSAEDEIYFIKKFIKGEPEPQIYGKVWFWDVDEKTGEYKKAYRSGLKVVIKGKNSQFETSTNNFGDYIFNDIPSDDYKIEPITPENFKYSGFDDGFFVFPNGRVGRYDSLGILDNLKSESKDLDKVSAKVSQYIQDSYFESIYLGRSNEIEGKVFDVNGKPINFASVELIPIQTPNRQISYKWAEKLWENKYLVGGEPPGKYLLAYEVNSFDQNGKLRRFYYPETTKPEKAKVFHIKPNDKFPLDLRVPLATKEIKGEILWEDGTKIDESNSIILSRKQKMSKDDFFYQNYLDETYLDELNRFSFQAFEDNEYWLHIFIEAENSTNKYIPIKLKPRKVKIEKKDVELKIFVPKPDILRKSN